MHFDGAAHQDSAKVEVIFILPEGDVLSYAFSLTKCCYNNVIEYQMLILGLKMATNIGVSHLEVLGDFKLVINQLLLAYDVKKPKLVPYIQLAARQLEKFDDISIEHVPRKENKQADALANLVTTLALSDVKGRIPICRRWVEPTCVPMITNDCE